MHTAAAWQGSPALTNPPALLCSGSSSRTCHQCCAPDHGLGVHRLPVPLPLCPSVPLPLCPSAPRPLCPRAGRDICSAAGDRMPSAIELPCQPRAATGAVFFGSCAGNVTCSFWREKTPLPPLCPFNSTHVPVVTRHVFPTPGSVWTGQGRAQVSALISSALFYPSAWRFSPRLAAVFDLRILM